ncbi:MAG: alpha/beta hydrolase [Myxococcales bacterium]|nr:alpha/beta hydrolase [Myxococcales bacterium]
MLPLLAHHLVSSDERAPEAWLLVLHGVFGLGANFRSIARALVKRRPEWGVVLVDLRGHGESQDRPPPHDLATAASDIEALVTRLGKPVAGILGHSFGGKVALAYLERHPGTMKVAFVLDSMPGARTPSAQNDTVTDVLGTLESLPRVLPSREAFKAELAARGYSSMIVDWLAMNVRRCPDGADGYNLRLDLPAIRSMLLDYWQRDLWPVMERASSAERLVLLVGGRSTVFGEPGLERAREAASSNPALRVEVLPNAGHWLHADDPEGVLALIDKHLPTL